MSMRPRWRPRRLNTLLVGFACMLALITAMGLQVRPFTYLWVSLYTGIAVAVLSISLTGRLEKQYQDEHDATLAAKLDLQRLSARLVAAQEEERQSLSRELHDQVGQTLTAIKIDLARAEARLTAAVGSAGGGAGGGAPVAFARAARSGGPDLDRHQDRSRPRRAEPAAVPKRPDRPTAPRAARRGGDARNHPAHVHAAAAVHAGRSGIERRSRVVHQAVFGQHLDSRELERRW